MQRLAGAHEHLDGDLTDARTLAGNLRDLRRINRFFGGVALSRRAIDALLNQSGRPPDAPDAPVTMLDVGTGAADIPAALVATWRRRGHRLTVLGVDSRAEVLAAATRQHPELLASGDLAFRIADGRSLPFDDGSFDVAHASLVLHHLDDADAATLVREMARVARRGIIVNDLSRGWVPWIGAWLLLHVVTRNAFTRHDGPLSVKRAYALAEARTLVTEAGLRVVHEENGFMGHRWAIAAVPG